MKITTKPVEYMDGKQKCIGYMAWDESFADPKPCVLVSHAWGGRDSFAEDKAIQMAAQGYVGFALDNYGRLSLMPTHQAYIDQHCKADMAQIESHLAARMAERETESGQPKTRKVKVG